jgi:hypothetical protein
LSDAWDFASGTPTRVSSGGRARTCVFDEIDYFDDWADAVRKRIPAEQGIKPAGNRNLDSPFDMSRPGAP